MLSCTTIVLRCHTMLSIQRRQHESQSTYFKARAICIKKIIIKKMCLIPFRCLTEYCWQPVSARASPPTITRPPRASTIPSPESTRSDPRGASTTNETQTLTKNALLWHSRREWLRWIEAWDGKTWEVPLARCSPMMSTITLACNKMWCSLNQDAVTLKWLCKIRFLKNMINT